MNCGRRRRDLAYKIRPGVVLLNICDTNLLTATHDVWKDCPKVRPIPRLWAACWKLLEMGKTEEDVLQTFSTMLGKTKEELHERFDGIFAKLAEEGFLIEEKEEPHEE